MYIVTLASASRIYSARTARTVTTLVSSLFAFAALAGCGNSMDTQPLAPASIVISTPSGTTTAAGTIQFSAVVKDANGRAITVTPAWSVVNGGGTITSTGLFTAGDSVGTFENTVLASSGSVTSASTVIVTAGELASITVTPDTGSLAIGATRHFVAVGKDAGGHVVEIPNRVWSVAHGGGAIDTSGLFTADTVAGSFANTVVARSGSISGTTSVTVLPGIVERIRINPDTAMVAVDSQRTFTAMGYDTYNNAVPVTPTWNVYNGGGAIDGNGVFTAGTVAGTFQYTVSARLGSHCGDPQAQATVIVQPGPLATITVSPDNPTVMAGATQQFTAAGADAHGNTVEITPQWSVVGTGGGTINSSTGLYTAGFAPGSYPNSVAAFVSSNVGLASVTIFFPPPPPPSLVPPVPISNRPH